MKFYRLLEAIPWVRESVQRKFGFTLFIGSQLTLLIYVAVKLAIGSPFDSGNLMLALSFNFGSWVATYAAMQLLLQPIEATAAALRAYLERRPVTPLFQEGHDLFGQLMRDADYIGKRAELDSSKLNRAIDDDLLTGLYSRRAGNRRLFEDVARSDRATVKFHLAFFSLHKLADIGTRHGNDKVDEMVLHVASLFSMNTRRADWVARWSEHVFAVGFCNNNQIHETVDRIHKVIEQSPIVIVPGELRSPIVACGVCEHSKGIEVQKLYDMALDAMRRAENAIDSATRSERVQILTPGPVLDAELQALMNN